VPVTVGNYATCESLGQATQEIQAAGLVLGVVFPSPENGDPNSQVAQQYPEPGTQVPPGTEVHLYVKGPADSCP
jgi:beta-lactam-binding protein with PASTA domain